MPEAFVSDKSVTHAVSRAVKAGKLRKLASRLYSRNMVDPPEAIVARNLWSIVAGYFPGALIADRTALENVPASDGSICLIAARGRDVRLPGHILRPRRGVAPLPADLPFLGELFLCSTARAFLENMRPSRARGGLVARTLGRAWIIASSAGPVRRPPSPGESLTARRRHRHLSPHHRPATTGCLGANEQFGADPHRKMRPGGWRPLDPLKRQGTKDSRLNPTSWQLGNRRS